MKKSLRKPETKHDFKLHSEVIFIKYLDNFKENLSNSIETNSKFCHDWAETMLSIL